MGVRTDCAPFAMRVLFLRGNAVVFEHEAALRSREFDDGLDCRKRRCDGEEDSDGHLQRQGNGGRTFDSSDGGLCKPQLHTVPRV